MRGWNDDDANRFLQDVMFDREREYVLQVTFPSTSLISRSNHHIPHLHMILGCDQNSVFYFERRYDLSAFVDDFFRSTGDIEESNVKSALAKNFNKRNQDHPSSSM